MAMRLRAARENGPKQMPAATHAPDQVRIRLTIEVLLDANGEDHDYLAERMQSAVYGVIAEGGIREKGLFTGDSSAVLVEHQTSTCIVDESHDGFPLPRYALSASLESALAGGVDSGPYPMFDPNWMNGTEWIMRLELDKAPAIAVTEMLDHADLMSASLFLLLSGCADQDQTLSMTERLKCVMPELESLLKASPWRIGTAGQIINADFLHDAPTPLERDSNRQRMNG